MLYNIYTEEDNHILVDCQKLKTTLESMSLVNVNELLVLSIHKDNNLYVLSINLNPIIKYGYFENLVFLVNDMLRDTKLDCTPLYNVFENSRVIRVTSKKPLKLSNVLTELNIQKTVFAYV